MRHIFAVALAGSFALLCAADRAAELHVAAGQSIQSAIDAAGDGAVINVDPGVFDERLDITKSVTIQGAGWQKTILKPQQAVPAHTNAQKIALADRLQSARDPQEQLRILSDYAAPPTISVRSTKNVALSGLRVDGIPLSHTAATGAHALITIENASARIIDCAAIGPSDNGLLLTDGSDVEIRRTLVAAVWGTGVAVDGDGPGAHGAKLHLVDCDIRNCYYAGITLRADNAVIQNCRISGSAWHGIRYDDCSPTIAGNLIFANARSGIYASGATRATVHDNVFWNNGMDGMSCWFDNADVIKRNTFVANLREGIAVLGDAAPTLTGNLFAQNPVAIDCGQIAGHGGNPRPAIHASFFWKNAADLTLLAQTQPPPPDSAHANPEFIDAARDNYSLAADSPAAQAGAGAMKMLPSPSPWPLQPQEKSIIPDDDSRDWNKWKKPPSFR